MRLLVFVISLVVPTLSLAQQAIEIETNRVAQHGYGDPSITYKPNVSGKLGVRVRCSSEEYTLDSAITPGNDETVFFRGLGVGPHQCTGTVRLTADDGSAGEMPLNLPIELLAPLEISVEAEHLNLQAKTLRVRASRPLDRVKIEVRGFKKSGGVAGGIVGEVHSASKNNPPATFLLGSTETSVPGMVETEVQWTQLDDDDEVLQIQVTGWDQQNFPGQVLLSPWAYSIPHEDVVFKTGSAVIDEAEVPKLQHAYAQVQQVLEKYGAIVVIKLYVAGYTDTVGSEANNQALSTKRSAAIANWFHQVGFSGSIFYQGFGESALAIPSGNDTPEARNRRAVYLLAAAIPPLSDNIPRNKWIPLTP